MIWLRALFFMIAVQAMAIAIIPWRLAGVGPHLPAGPWRVIGALLLVAGGLAIIWSDWAFVAYGRGTAAPYDPPRALVAKGLYRHVRNPMYVGAATVILGVALLTGAVIVFAYALGALVVCHGLIRLYEEPHLRQVFGASYAEYLDAVPRWLPRLTPWRAPMQER